MQRSFEVKDKIKVSQLATQLKASAWKPSEVEIANPLVAISVIFSFYGFLVLKKNWNMPGDLWWTYPLITETLSGFSVATA